MSTKSKRHIHKYHKVDAGFGTLVWACGLPDCNHHMPPHYAGLVNGKASICWACGEQMVLDPVAMREDMPRCINCRSSIDTDEISANDRLSKLVDGL